MNKFSQYFHGALTLLWAFMATMTFVEQLAFPYWLTGTLMVVIAIGAAGDWLESKVQNEYPAIDSWVRNYRDSQ